ncbi:hypothetical protein H0H93_001801 [Arthromyces matolae]|nr:hypothetical protein H0H93_001801 [Arthromyces matolae]
MPNPMLNNRPFLAGLGRNHNYQAIYESDPRGQEASENARLWRVYLDEADAYDSDMIDGFRTILDGLLVFASLFSAVVTTFVTQTSQVLQPDNAQITVSLLIETNQLLRAAGNGTTVDTVAHSTLGPKSLTYTQTDVWVNGLFFTSLTLSVTTALLTVLVKQWIQGYIEVVPGNAQTQALIRQFRFDGLVKWHLKAIIEGLPLILHTSVAIFLTGLSLYISQISRSICVIISIITASTFIFYLATSMIPAFFIDCPYRLPSMFLMTRFLIMIALPPYYAFRDLVAKVVPYLKDWSIPPAQRRSAPLHILRKEESFRGISDHQVWRCLSWLFAHSTNTSTKDIVVEGVSGALDDQVQRRSLPGSKGVLRILHETGAGSLLLEVLEYCVACQTELEDTPNSDELISTKSIWNTAITVILSAPTIVSKSLHNLPYPETQRLIRNDAFAADIWKLYVAAFRRGESKIITSYRCLMQVAHIPQTISLFIATSGNEADIRCAMDRGTKGSFHLCDDFGATWLHYAVTRRNTEFITPLLEMAPELINVRTTQPYQRTALEFILYHFEQFGTPCDLGWDRTTTNDSGETPVEVARRRADYFHSKESPGQVNSMNKIIEFLETYQTVRLRDLRMPLMATTTAPDSGRAQDEMEIPISAMAIEKETDGNGEDIPPGNDFEINWGEAMSLGSPRRS